MAALFLGRLGGVALNLVFLPLYDRWLGPELFGAVALVLSVQAFFLLFDFGFATLLGSEVSRARHDAHARGEVAADWRLTERLVPASGLAVGAAAALALWLVRGSAGMFRPIDLLLTALLVVGMIQLNAGQAVLNAAQWYKVGSFLSLSGTLGRGLAALAMFRFFGAGFTVFLTSQVLVIVAQMLVQSWFIRRELGIPAMLRGRALPLWRRLQPLMAYGLAGALLMQIDKPLVGASFSLEAAGRWYLATTFALTPVAMMAGPLNQYFFPRLVAALGDARAAVQVGQMFQVAIVLMVTAPTVVLTWYAPLLVSLWLPYSPDAAAIASLARPMTAAAAIGAMGYLPTAFLVGSGDRAWLAGLSWAMLVCVGAGLLLASTAGALFGYSIVYSIYHVTGCLLLWGRMLCTWPGREAALTLLRGCWLLPMALTMVPTVVVLALLSLLPLPFIVQMLGTSVLGGLAMALVAWRWWLSYGAGPAPNDGP